MPMNPEQMRAAGDWINQLRVLLKMRADAGTRPTPEHRSTKKAVRLLLKNLKEGAEGKDRDGIESDKREHARKLIFNAVDLLLDDKVSKSKKGKTKLEAIRMFREQFKQQFEEQGQKENAIAKNWKFVVVDALDGLMFEEMEKGFLAGTVPPEEMLTEEVIGARFHLRGQIVNATDPTKLDGAQKSFWFDEAEKAFGQGLSATTIASTEKGRLLLEAKPKLRSKVMASLDPDLVDDFLNRYPAQKTELVTAGLLAVAGRRPPVEGEERNPDLEINPKLFKKLAKTLTPEQWNDKASGLGPRVCQALWTTGNYDQIAELVNHGVDTSLAARFPGLADPANGIYSGFFQPIEHVVQKHLKDVGLLDKKPCPLKGEALEKAKGAKTILEALEKKGATKTVTRWDQVENSEMVKQFKKNPGTIWGFEDVRLPFVQASHDTKKGVQPIRMMELWEAIEPSLTPKTFAELLADPNTAADKFVALGVDVIEKGVASGDGKYAQIADQKDKYIKEFKKSAKSFLMEFASQMPKMAFTDPSLTNPGDSAVALTDIAGVQAGKFGGGLACKAGLWWAKQEKKPVYYCLDGIDMKDVTDYKKVKNKAIDDFLATGGKPGKGHDEVITLVELREIIKNWEDMRGTVKFVDKGKILQDEVVEKRVKAWKERLEKANQEAGRRPAPPRAKFAQELNNLDPGLMAQFPATAEGDMDARDIVKKSAYLVKIANTRPAITLKYLMSRCTVLVTYKLITKDVPLLAVELNGKKGGEVAEALKALVAEIDKCNKLFREPLKASLARYAPE